MKMTAKALATGVCAAAALGIATAAVAQDLSPWVDSEGTISLPDNFRTEMAHLGSWFVPEGDASGFHNVYTEPESVASFRENGVFPDGAVLVKELRAHSTGDYTTGAGVSYENETIKQWFVMVKDSTDRFADSNGSWGDGWGWALFKTDDPSTNVSADYKAGCLGCHVPAQDKDWICTEAYPILVE
ncbi:cytochrome P460 family protein [Halomonas sp. BN3-1]|uniref:cytochrome P460 family protein n=1 Tax=Halomonas sp. BN3-1 TaxID=2082393 RepID=UPI001F066069|nr:cytochrome P460 family protein [Halomonas sp. BN3-1]